MKTYVLVAGDPGVASLIEAAASLGQPVVAVVAGSGDLAQVVNCPGVDQVIWLGEVGDHALEAFAEGAATVIEQEPGILMSGRRPAERVLLGVAAARIMAPVVSGVQSVALDDGKTLVTHGVYGGIAQAITFFDGPVALCMDGGAAVNGGGSAEVVNVEVIPSAISVVSMTANTQTSVDLGSATRVIGVGRGLKAEEDLRLIEDLSTKVQAEIGCSRPLSEGLNWLGRDQYIGVSGAHISPDLYIMIGISGQLQHVSGCRGSKIIVSINTDKDAPATHEADYVLTGDLYALVPALIEALQ